MGNSQSTQSTTGVLGSYERLFFGFLGGLVGGALATVMNTNPLSPLLIVVILAAFAAVTAAMLLVY